MKILELCLSPDLGGLELYAYRTTLELRKKSLYVDFFLAPASKLQERARADGHSFTIFSKRGKSMPILSSRRLAKYIDRQDIDIVHVHWAKDIALAVLAKKWAERDVRIVYTRQMEILGPKKDLYHDFIYKNIDLLITITDRLKNQATRFTNIDPGKVVRLYYGVNADDSLDNRHCEKFRIEQGIDKNAFVVGVVGRVEEFKGQHLLLDAIDLLIRKGINIHGVIVGNAMNEEYLSALKKQVKNGKAGGKISFLDFQPNPGLIMACLDTLVLTTRLETFGLVLIEAMRAGIPVIGTDAGGVPEIIENGINGLVYPPDDANILAENIERFISDAALRKRCVENGQSIAMEKFSSEKHYSDLVTLLTYTLR